MNIVKTSLVISTYLLLSACSDMSLHEKLSNDAKEKYLGVFKELDICSINRPSYERDSGSYSSSISYLLCKEDKEILVSAPFTGLIHSIKIDDDSVSIDVENWQLEKINYSELEKAYLSNEGEIDDALLVIKNDIMNRKLISRSHGLPIEAIDSMEFIFTEVDAKKLEKRLTAHICKSNKECFQ
jgi:hypothetical protein